jgi:hypothetical protein
MIIFSAKFCCCGRDSGSDIFHADDGFLSKRLLDPRTFAPEQPIEDELNFANRQCAGGRDMNDTSSEFERLLGHAALKLWPDLPRDVQELLFETAVPNDPLIRNRLAVFLHDRHPRTAHPPKPTQLA